MAAVSARNMRGPKEIFKQLKRDQSTLDKNELGHN